MPRKVNYFFQKSEPALEPCPHLQIIFFQGSAQDVTPFKALSSIPHSFPPIFQL